MARKMPQGLRLFTHGLRWGWFENRIIKLIFCGALVLSSAVFSIENDPATKKTLMFLQMDFENKPVSMQKTLLRDMALLNTEDSVPFFVNVALDSKYQEEVRREALKGMLAVDSKKYAMALDALQNSPLEEDRLIRNLLQVDGVDLLPTFMRSLTFQEERRIIDMKISAILQFWKDSEIKDFDYSLWPSDKASEVLSSLISTTSSTRQKVRLIKLWGNVRDEKSTKEMVKVLDQPNARVQEAMIFALSEPGPSAVSALGRFLQKSKNPQLRKRAIYALRKIGSDSAKMALKSYQRHATKKEKVWIRQILKK